MLNFLKQNSGKLLPQSTRKLFVKQTKQGGLQNSCGNLILNYKQVVTKSLFVVAFLVSSWLGACFANGGRNFELGATHGSSPSAIAVHTAVVGFCPRNLVRVG